jgi:ABC-type phosphate transport system permease subunit
VTGTATQPDGAGSSARERRPTPPSAFGEPTVWLMGAALVSCLALVIVTIALILGQGLATLWPKPVERVELRSGEVFLAMPMGSETFELGPSEEARIAELGLGTPDGTGEPPTRFRFRLGNRDLGREPFRWVPEYEIVSRSPVPDAVVVERDEWGIFIGMPSAVLVRTETVEPTAAPFMETSPVVTQYGSGTAMRTIVGQAGNQRTVREDLLIAEGPEATLDAVGRLGRPASVRRSEIERLQRSEMPRVQDRLSELTWRERRVRSLHASPPASNVPGWLWGLGVAGVLGSAALAVALLRGSDTASRRRRTGALALAVVSAVGLLFVWLERPVLRERIDDEGLVRAVEAIEEERRELGFERDEILARIRMLERQDSVLRLVITDPSLDRMAPIAQSQPEEPMLLSQARRLVPVNDLGFAGRVGVYLSRWGDFLSRPPGESPGDGGVFPVIVGTVVLTLLLTVSVVPLGVVAAIYLREYAHQGAVTSAIRIAINNLAGVPSIVYGMFGLGFFCYTVGGYLDSGPGEAAIARTPWWSLLAVLGGVVVLAGLLTSVASAGSDVTASSKSLFGRVARIGSGWIWIGAVALAAYLIWTTPYFGGFFFEKLPEQSTFGGRGILWAALTLALLTLPVVIVATEEAIAAVPASMREGSIGCGASRWQTIRRIVLPASMPGVLTGAILAMARGAGEVAPLMLVGAVNLAPALPVSGEAPFLHGDRTFMHLGFHIYNLGFQSPDAEAARPLVWTTTLLLVAIVLGLNLAAMLIRARLPGRGPGGQM